MTSRRSVPTLYCHPQQHAPVPLIETQTGAIEVRHVVRRVAGVQAAYHIEECIAVVRHRATAVFGSSSGGAGSSADGLMRNRASQFSLLYVYEPTGTEANFNYN